MYKCEYCNSKLVRGKRNTVICSNKCWEKEPYKTQRMMDRFMHENIAKARGLDNGL